MKDLDAAAKGDSASDAGSIESDDEDGGAGANPDGSSDKSSMQLEYEKLGQDAQALEAEVRLNTPSSWQLCAYHDLMSRVCLIAISLLRCNCLLKSKLNVND